MQSVCVLSAFVTVIPTDLVMNIKKQMHYPCLCFSQTQINYTPKTAIHCFCTFNS